MATLLMQAVFYDKKEGDVAVLSLVVTLQPKKLMCMVT